MSENAKGPMLPRVFLAAWCMVCLVFTVCGDCVGGEAPRQLRYFMQPPHAEGSPTPYGNNTAAGSYVQAGDAKIYYEVYGAGSVIFVFHGGGLGCPYELGRIIDELRRDHKVVVVSSRGHGRSEIGHSPMSLRQKAEDMLTVMEKITDRPCAILGFSDGAYTALEVAALRPQAVERVVAIGAGTLERGFFPAKLPLVDLEKLDKDYVEQMRALAPEPQRLGGFLNDYMRLWHDTQVGRELFGAIRCPVLFVVGDGDTHAPVRTVLAAKDMTANARLCVVPHAGHAAFLDNYPVAWPSISQFLNAPLQELEKGAEPAKL